MGFSRRGVRVLRIHQVFPVWTLADPSLSNAVFMLCMQGMGVDTVASYLRKFAVLNCLCALVCACFGAAFGGVLGIAIGALGGLAVPAAILWCAITVIRVVVHLLLFYGAWVALFYLVRWLFLSGN